MKREDIIKIIDGEVYYHYDYTDYLYNIINKAIEYLEKRTERYHFTVFEFDELLDILKGEDKE